MKKNLVMRIAAVVLMCTLVTACFASSTFARYTSSTNEDANVARVAKWEITVGTNDPIDITGDPETVTFDIFSTANFTDQNGESETDVLQSGTSLVIAPGTKGSFAIDKITNNSEVTAEVKLNVVSVASNNIPVKFYTDEALQTEISLDAGLDLLAKNGKALKLSAGESTEVTNIYWVWDFDANTSGTAPTDTDLGVSAQEGPITYTVTLQLVADQVD